MSPLALGLILVSVCLHAGWNLLGKRRSPSLAFFALASACGGLLLTPLLWVGPSPLALPPAFWGWLAASGVCQMLYMGGLAWAYARGEISVLYPIARALPVVLVPLITLGALGQRGLGPADMLGMALIVIGALCLPLAGPMAFQPRRYLTPALGFALLAAAGTAGYSVIDKQALDLMLDSGYSSLMAGLHFMVLQALVTPLWAIPVIALISGERHQFKILWRGERATVPLTGLMITGTYGLVLMAMALTEEVSHVVAMRQLSIPLGVLMGIVWLKESAPPIKLLGTAIMLGGLSIVALA